MSKPWPTTKQIVEASQSLPQPWPQLPSTIDCGHNAVARAEIEIDSAEVVSFSSVSKPATTVAQQAPGRWQKGVSGNPQGRARGSKHKISELARAIFAEDFAQHGQETLERVRAIDPVAYMQLIIKLVPRELILQQERGLCIDFGALTDEEFAKVLEEAMKRGKYEKMLETAVKVAQGKR